MRSRYLFLLILLTMGACRKGDRPSADGDVVLTLGAYTVPKEAYQKEILPAFRQYWKEKTGQTVRFEESYIGSGAQSRAIAAGFEADIAALSLEKDVQRLADLGLIEHDWKGSRYGGFVTRSVVVIAFREGNPRNIRDWEDLTREDVRVLYPSPKTSGGAMWDVNAIYGAGLRSSEDRSGTADPAYAKSLLKSIQRNVRVMDKSARASMTTFENGIGDAILTYENEVLLRHMQERALPFVIPRATILIENPIAVIDRNVDKHGNREAAEAFVDFVMTEASQRAFAEYGFRSVNDRVAAAFAEKYPRPELLFDIEYLGGWENVHTVLYGPEGAWTEVVDELARE